MRGRMNKTVRYSMSDSSGRLATITTSLEHDLQLSSPHLSVCKLTYLHTGQALFEKEAGPFLAFKQEQQPR